MANKPTYEELEQRIKELEREREEYDQADEALRESAKEYRSTLNDLLVGVVVHGSDSSILLSNSEASNILGLTHEQMLGKEAIDPAWHFLHEDSTVMKIEDYPVSRVLSTKIPIQNYVLGIKRPDREYITWVIANAIPVFSNDKELEKIIVNFVDISSQKRAEEALRKSEEKYKKLIEGLDEAIYRMSLPDGKYEYMSPAARKVFGYSPEEFMENPLVMRRIIHPDFAEYFKEKWEDLIEGKMPPTYKYKILDPEGNERWIVQSNTGILDDSGNVIAIEGLCRNITKGTLTEGALRESEEKYRSLVESIDDSIYLIDKNCIYLFMNQKHLSRLGLQPEEFIGRTYGEFHSENDTREFDVIVQKVFETGRPIQLEHRSPKGNNRHFLRTLSPVKDLDGKTRAITVVSKNITERVMTEDALRKSEEKLARAEKIEAMGLMAGGVAHDLNNILSGIVSYPELLLMDLPEDSPLRKPIKTIQESGMRAADVVKDLLTIARGVASGKEVLNLNTLTTEYLASAEHQKLEKIHPVKTFKTELDSDLLNITGSASHVMKILMNLIANASEAIEDKGTVTVSTMNRYLDEPLKGYEDVDTGEYVMLTVSDDGSGISPTDLERIFEPFYTKKVMGRSGTGLGLAVVWNSMQDHGGYINVNTSEKGTTFELYFPTTREQIAADKEEIPLDAYIGHGEKVLVVDDEERQKEIASGILTRLGYTAGTVSSGEEAIEYIKENAVDLIVLDMVMPKGIDGCETYEAIIKIHPGQKAIIASGYAKTKEVEMAQTLGAGKYIMKPYTLAKVGAAVKEELEK